MHSSTHAYTTLTPHTGVINKQLFIADNIRQKLQNGELLYL